MNSNNEYFNPYTKFDKQSFNTKMNSNNEYFNPYTKFDKQNKKYIFKSPTKSLDSNLQPQISKGTKREESPPQKPTKRTNSQTKMDKSLPKGKSAEIHSVKEKKRPGRLSKLVGFKIKLAQNPHVSTKSTKDIGTESVRQRETKKKTVDLGAKKINDIQRQSGSSIEHESTAQLTVKSKGLPGQNIRDLDLSCSAIPRRRPDRSIIPGPTKLFALNPEMRAIESNFTNLKAANDDIIHKSETLPNSQTRILASDDRTWASFDEETVSSFDEEGHFSSTFSDDDYSIESAFQSPTRKTFPQITGTGSSFWTSFDDFPFPKYDNVSEISESTEKDDQLKLEEDDYNVSNSQKTFSQTDPQFKTNYDDVWFEDSDDNAKKQDEENPLGQFKIYASATPFGVNDSKVQVCEVLDNSDNQNEKLCPLIKVHEKMVVDFYKLLPATKDAPNNISEISESSSFPVNNQLSVDQVDESVSGDEAKSQELLNKQFDYVLLTEPDITVQSPAEIKMSRPMRFDRIFKLENLRNETESPIVSLHFDDYSLAENSFQTALDTICPSNFNDLSVEKVEICEYVIVELPEAIKHYDFSRCSASIKNLNSSVSSISDGIHPNFSSVFYFNNRSDGDEIKCYTEENCDSLETCAPYVSAQVSACVDSNSEFSVASCDEDIAWARVEGFDTSNSHDVPSNVSYVDLEGPAVLETAPKKCLTPQTNDEVVNQITHLESDFVANLPCSDTNENSEAKVSMSIADNLNLVPEIIHELSVSENAQPNNNKRISSCDTNPCSYSHPQQKLELICVHSNSDDPIASKQVHHFNESSSSVNICNDTLDVTNVDPSKFASDVKDTISSSNSQSKFPHILVSNDSLPLNNYETITNQFSTTPECVETHYSNSLCSTNVLDSEQLISIEVNDENIYPQTDQFQTKYTFLTEIFDGINIAPRVSPDKNIYSVVEFPASSVPDRVSPVVDMSLVDLNFTETPVSDCDSLHDVNTETESSSFAHETDYIYLNSQLQSTMLSKECLDLLGIKSEDPNIIYNKNSDNSKPEFTFDSKLLNSNFDISSFLDEIESVPSVSPSPSVQESDQSLADITKFIEPLENANVVRESDSHNLESKIHDAEDSVATICFDHLEEMVDPFMNRTNDCCGEYLMEIVDVITPVSGTIREDGTSKFIWRTSKTNHYDESPGITGKNSSFPMSSEKLETKVNVLTMNIEDAKLEEAFDLSSVTEIDIHNSPENPDAIDYESDVEGIPICSLAEENMLRALMLASAEESSVQDFIEQFVVNKKECVLPERIQCRVTLEEEFQLPLKISKEFVMETCGEISQDSGVRNKPSHVQPVMHTEDWKKARTVEVVCLSGDQKTEKYSLKNIERSPLHEASENKNDLVNSKRLTSRPPIVPQKARQPVGSQSVSKNLPSKSPANIEPNRKKVEPVKGTVSQIKRQQLNRRNVGTRSLSRPKMKEPNCENSPKETNQLSAQYSSVDDILFSEALSVGHGPVIDYWTDVIKSERTLFGVPNIRSFAVSQQCLDEFEKKSWLRSVENSDRKFSIEGSDGSQNNDMRLFFRREKSFSSLPSARVSRSRPKFRREKTFSTKKQTTDCNLVKLDQLSKNVNIRSNISRRHPSLEPSVRNDTDGNMDNLFSPAPIYSNQITTSFIPSITRLQKMLQPSRLFEDIREEHEKIYSLMTPISGSKKLESVLDPCLIEKSSIHNEISNIPLIEENPNPPSTSINHETTHFDHDFQSDEDHPYDDLMLNPNIVTSTVRNIDMPIDNIGIVVSETNSTGENKVSPEIVIVENTSFRSTSSFMNNIRRTSRELYNYIFNKDKENNKPTPKRSIRPSSLSLKDKDISGRPRTSSLPTEKSTAKKSDISIRSKESPMETSTGSSTIKINSKVDKVKSKILHPLQPSRISDISNTKKSSPTIVSRSSLPKSPSSHPMEKNIGAESVPIHSQIHNPRNASSSRAESNNSKIPLKSIATSKKVENTRQSLAGLPPRPTITTVRGKKISSLTKSKPDSEDGSK